MKDKIKVVISDLDGTLLMPDHQLGIYTKRVVKAVKEAGYHFWIATGRHHSDAKGISRKLDVETVLITANGATVSDASGALTREEQIPRAAVEGILALPFDSGVYQNLYQGELWLMEREDKVFENYYADEDFKYTLCRFEDHLHKPVNKIFYTSLEHQKLLPIAKAVDEAFGDVVDWTFSMPECLEIMPKGSNKGDAILKTLEAHGFKAEEVVAFGDGLNDLEMLSVLPHGKVMQNANPILIEKLPHREIIGHNGDEAVARWLVEHLELSVDE
ncbi:Cof-type HAD-IIB family hydrolase [Fusibacter sp. JL298sf-3]